MLHELKNGAYLLVFSHIEILESNFHSFIQIVEKKLIKCLQVGNYQIWGKNGDKIRNGHCLHRGSSLEV